MSVSMFHIQTNSVGFDEILHLGVSIEIFLEDVRVVHISRLPIVQIERGVHPASYAVGTTGSFSWGKAAGT